MFLIHLFYNPLRKHFDRKAIFAAALTRHTRSFRLKPAVSFCKQMNFMGFKLAGSKYCLTIKVALRKPVTSLIVVGLHFGQQTSPYMVFAKWGFPIACFRRLVKKETLISYHVFNSPFLQPTSQTL